MINTAICGIRYLNICGTLIFAIDAVTNRHTPSGGVTIPIVKLTAIIMPKWIGSIPATRINGKNNGVKIDTALIVSINVPEISKTTLIINNNNNGLSATGPRISFNWLGIWLKDRN